MKRIVLLVIVCFVLLAGCSLPAEVPVSTPESELPSPPSTPDLPNLTDVLLTEEEPVVEEPVVDEPVVKEPSPMFSLVNWHPHPSVVGLPEEIPMGYLAEPGTEVERYLTLPREECEDVGGGVYLIGFDDTFVYDDDRGIEGLRNPTYAELVAFLAEDKTSEHPFEVRYWIWSEETPGEKVYITEEEVEALEAKGDDNYYNEPVFVCTDFSLMLRENANRAGWRCAVLSVGFLLHVRNAFETVDRGLVWVEPQSDVLLKPVTDRYTPYPIRFGDEGGTMRPDFEGWEGIIVYVW